MNNSTFKYSKDKGFSLVELVVSMALMIMTLSLSLPLLISTQRVYGSIHQRHTASFSSKQVFLEVKSIVNEQGRLWTIPPYFINSPSSISLLRLDLGNIYKLKDNQFCKIISGGEKPKAWLLLAASGFSIVKGDIDRRPKCAGFRLEEALYEKAAKNPLTERKEITLIAVDEFFALSLEGQELWKRSLIKQDNLLLQKALSNFSVRALPENSFELELQFQKGRVFKQSFYPVIFPEENRFELLF